MTWIIVANTNQAKIYDYHKKPRSLHLLEEINHPENKLKSKDLGTDRPGHYKTSSTTRGSFSSMHDLEEVNLNHFAHELAEKIDKARTQHLYEDLVLVMPSQMEGIFLKHLNKHSTALIKKTIHKNMNFMKDYELLKFLH